MKKILTFAIMAIMTVAAYAQPSASVGYANSTIHENNSSMQYNGVFAGIENMQCSYGLGYKYGLTLSYFENNSSLETSIGSGSLKYNEMYLELPLDIVYKFDGGIVNIYPYAGITPSFGIFSNVTASADALGVKTKDSENLYNDYGYKRFDILAGGGIIVDAAFVKFNIGYDYGLISRYEDGDVHRTLFHFGVGLDL